jgi:hypothetical protein
VKTDGVGRGKRAVLVVQFVDGNSIVTDVERRERRDRVQ